MIHYQINDQINNDDINRYNKNKLEHLLNLLAEHGTLYMARRLNFGVKNRCTRRSQNY